jgi:hypothetical protein
MPILPECPPPPTTKCDRDKVNNVWVEGHDPEHGVPGICILDTLEDYQVIHILERDERARADLKKVTSDAHLLDLAEKIPRLPETNEGDEDQRDHGNTTNASPFYTVFRGQPPFAQ